METCSDWSMRTTPSSLKLLIWSERYIFLDFFPTIACLTHLVLQMKSDFHRMEDEMSLLSGKMQEIMSASTSINSALASRRQQIAKLSGVHHLLKKVTQDHTTMSSDHCCVVCSCSFCLSCQPDWRSALRWKLTVRQSGVWVCVRMCACVCECVCMHACMCVYAFVCVCLYVYVCCGVPINTVIITTDTTVKHVGYWRCTSTCLHSKTSRKTAQKSSLSCG